MKFKKINFTVDKNIAMIEMNYPKNFNAIDEIMAEELQKSLKLCNDDKIKVVIIKGNKKYFSAGGDINFFYDKLISGGIDNFEIVKMVFDISNTIRKLPKPVIAACSGAVAGAGANLALSCDFVFVSKNVRFIQAFVNLGLIPDDGGVFLLSKDIGWHRTIDLIMTGRDLDAEEGLRLGIFKKICNVDSLDKKTMDFALKLAKGPSVSYANSKKLIYETIFRKYLDYKNLEYECQLECAKTEDFKEGIFSFKEKRGAKFKGK